MPQTVRRYIVGALTVLAIAALSTTALRAQAVGSGTGFVVNERGDMVTNQHVIVFDDDGEDAYCGALQVVGRDFWGAAEIIGVAPYQDLAVLRFIEMEGGGRPSNEVAAGPPPAAVSAPPERRGGWRNVVELTTRERRQPAAQSGAVQPKSDRPAGFAVFTASRPVPGEPVVALGYPYSSVLADEAKVSTGVVAALSGPNNDTTTLQHTAPTNPGNSGGPLFDETGRVVGVTSARLAIEEQQNQNFAIHAQVVTTLLQSLRVPFQIAEAATPVRVQDVVDVASAYTVKIVCHR